MNIVKINKVLTKLIPKHTILRIIQCKDDKLNKIYNVFEVQTEQGKFILKRNTDHDELNAYKNFSNDGNFKIPKLISSHIENNEVWLLLSHSGNQDIRGHHMDSVICQIAEAIAEIHLFYHNTQKKSYKYYRDILKLIPSEYKTIYELFLRRIALRPWTIIHNDLLPINVLLDTKTITIIDWEPKYGPYFLDVARLIAHRDNEGNKYMPNDFISGFRDDYYALVMTAYNVEYCEYNKDVALGIIFEYIQVLKHYWRSRHFDSTYDRYILDLKDAITEFYKIS